MTTRELAALFESFRSDHREFKDVVAPRSRRPDLHAFLLLSDLFPGEGDLVSGADHDVIYLSVDEEDLVRVLTPDQVHELVRCGVRYERGLGLSMFV